MERAKEKLKLVVPLTLFIVFFLLYMNFNAIGETLVVMLSVPFALVGGVWLLDLLDYNLSVAVWVGIIALVGVAAETGVVMLVYLDEAWNRRVKEGRTSYADLREAVIEGAVQRVRPKIMTVGTTIIGLLPIMVGMGTGSDVMKRVAAPMVGGLITSAILTLAIIPAIYVIWKGWGLPREEVSKQVLPKTLLYALIAGGSIVLIAGGYSFFRESGPPQLSSRVTITTAQSAGVLITLLGTEDGISSGENTLELAFTNAISNVPSEVRDVSLEFFMPAMGAMPPMQSKAGVTSLGDPGRFRAVVNVPMPGEWQVTVRFQGPEEEGSQTFGVVAQ